MSTRKLAPDEWKPALDALSRTYQGALVSLEILSRQLGDQPEFRDMPLNGVVCEGRGITFQVARGNDHISHPVPEPSCLWIHERADGAVVALEVLSGDGTGALMTFKSPMRAEILDRAVE